MITILRDALRQLRRSPGYAVVGALSLGAGIGAVTAVFSLVNGLFFRTPPGIEGPDRLVAVEASVASYPNFRDLRDGAGEVLELAAFSDHLLGLEVEGRTRQVLGLFVSPGYFRTLGTRAAVGRLPGPESGGSESSRHRAVLSHRAWNRYFAGDTAVIGRPVRVNGTPLTVVGVAEEGFHGSFVGFQFDVWMPATLAPSVGAGPDPEAREADRLELVGRMRPGVELEGVRGALGTAAAALRREFPGVNDRLDVQVRRYTGFDEEVRGPAVALSSVLVVLGLSVMLVAVANATGLQLARSVARSRDLALRKSLGAGTRHVAGLVLAESVIVAGLGAVLGVGALRWLSLSLPDLIPEFPVQLALEFPVDARVVAFAVLVTLVGGVAAGFFPALRARRTSLRALLGSSGSGEQDGLRGLRLSVVAQVAVSVLLLATAGVFVRTVARAGVGDPGYRTEGVMVAPFLDLSAAGTEREAASALYEDLRERVSRVPGVERAALTTRVPMGFTGRSTDRVRLPGRRLTPAGEGLEVGVTAVSPGFFATLGIPLLEGRAFQPDPSGEALSHVVVSGELARRVWGEESPLGRRLLLGDRELRVAGVSRDVRSDAFQAGARPHVYVDLRQFPDLRPALLVRTASPAVAGPVREAVAAVEPRLPAPELQTLEGFLGIALVPQRLGGKIGGFLGLLSLLLAGVGLYAMVGFWVSRRIREIGIRVAIGADPAAVYRSVVGRGAVLAAWGTGIGLLLAVAATRFLGSAIRGIGGAGPLVLGAVSAAILFTVVVATTVPARRAVAVDPAEILRTE